jgi:hypothetical protein
MATDWSQGLATGLSESGMRDRADLFRGLRPGDLTTGLYLSPFLQMEGE